MRQTLDQLALLIRARYPLIQLLTFEEDRVERALDRLAGQEGLSCYTWRSTTGIVGPESRPLEGTADPEGALRAIGSIEDKALFVFYDLHPYLTDQVGSGNGDRRSRLVRLLRDHALRFGRRGQTLVLVGPRQAVPRDLEKEMVVLDMPLPGREDVARLLQTLLKSQNMEMDPDLAEAFVKGSLGLNEREIKRLYSRVLLSGGGFGEADLSKLVEEKRQAIRRSRFLEFWDHGGKMRDVGGMDNLKKWLEQRQLAFTRKARDFGLPEPKGLFLLGVQGCGKSLMAKAVADLWRFPLLRLDVAAVFHEVGSSEESLRDTVRVAESLAPVVLWIDELEKGFLGGGNVGQAFGDFLTWMQEKTSPVFVVATANEVRVLPPELLRKGRFDEIFFVDLPNVHERLQILEIHLRMKGRKPEQFDLISVAEETDKFSGAELEQVVVSALFHAFSDGRELQMDDLLDVARESVPLAVTMDDRLKELREWAYTRARPASQDRTRIDFFEEWGEAG
jgi:AAA+ superfamily predicted ATPase